MSDKEAGGWRAVLAAHAEPRLRGAAAAAAAASSNPDLAFELHAFAPEPRRARAHQLDAFAAEPRRARWEHCKGGKHEGTWHPFSEHVEPAIETAYQSGLTSTTFVHCGKTYVVDFKSMQQTCQSDRNCRRRVRRVDPLGTTWEYKGSRGEWYAFWPEHDKVLEMAYNMNAPAVRIGVLGHMYEIDFRESCQFRLDSLDRRRQIRRAAQTAGPSEAQDSCIPLAFAAIGVRVQRGPDWDGGDEDGGEGSQGTTTPEVEELGWVAVQWDADRWRIFRYRVGAEGKFELMVLPGRPVIPRDCRRTVRTEKCSRDVDCWVQELFIKTYRQKKTRDRLVRAGPSPVPSKYIVTEVLRVINEAALARFQQRLKEVTPMACRWDWDEVRRPPCMSQQAEVCRLFHGSSRENLHSIVQGGGFDLSQVKDGLLGRAIFFTESVTKADEYSPDGDGPAHALLICRVALGRVHYTDEPTPNKAAIDLGFRMNVFDSVLNDRLATRDTYREFAIRDEAQAYPEFLVFYQRA